MLPCALEQVAHASRQFSHLLLPVKEENVLIVLAETTIFVKEARFHILAA
jgi:hypothetical protein